MSGARVIRLAEAELVALGPSSNYRQIVGDEAGTTPVRTGIQTCLPNYEVPLHRHPYMEVIHVLEGTLAFWLGDAPDDTQLLRPGDTVEIQPGAWHGFRTHGNETLRILGIHASPKRIVEYKDGIAVDARGYRVVK